MSISNKIVFLDRDQVKFLCTSGNIRMQGRDILKDRDVVESDLYSPLRDGGFYQKLINDAQGEG